MKLTALKIGDKFSIIDSLVKTTFGSGTHHTILVNDFEIELEHKKSSKYPRKRMNAIVSHSFYEKVKENSDAKIYLTYIFKSDSEKVVFTVKEIFNNRIRAEFPRYYFNHKTKQDEVNSHLFSFYFKNNSDKEIELIQ